jgi:aryl-alcohol dehydrogenase-like predicted oxidoreductase
MVGDDVDLQVAAVRAALAGGVNFFDTAAAYGDGKSETSLGRALAIAGAAPAVSSKVLITADQLGDIRAATLASVAASLKRLRLDRLDGLVLHNRVAWQRDPDRIVGIGPLLSVDDVLGPYAAAIADLRASGLVRVAGFTTFGGEPSAIDEVAAAGIFDVINADFSAARPTAGHPLPVPGQPDYRSVIDRCAAYGLTSLAIRVLGNGRLVRPDVLRTPLETAVAGFLRQAAGSVAAGAIRFALSKPGVTSAIIGFSHPDHVHDAVAAAAAGPLPAGRLRQFRALLASQQESPAQPAASSMAALSTDNRS